jgi:hypothetical protein
LSVSGAKVASEDSVISLSNAVAANKSNADSNISRIDARVDSVLSNADPVALNSLAEVVKAFQDADGNLNGAITNLASSASGDVASLSNIVAQNKSDANAAIALKAAAADVASFSNAVASNKTATDAAIALKAAAADLVSLSNAVASNKSDANAAIALKAAAADLVSFSNATTSNLALKATASDMTIVKAALLNQYLPSASNPSDSNQAKGQAMMQMLMKPMTMYIEGNIAGNYNMTLDASASATALPYAFLVSDGAAPVRDATYNSWRYINDAAAALKKINWYFMDNLPALATANLTTTAITTVMNAGSPFMYSNFKCMYAKVRMNVTSTGPMGGPYFAVYTAPTVSSWYRSRKNYTFYNGTANGTGSVAAGRTVVLYCGMNPKTAGVAIADVADADYVQVGVENSAGSTCVYQNGTGNAQTGDIGATEVVYKIALMSNSGGGISSGQVDFTCFEFGYCFGSSLFKTITSYSA